MCAALNLTLASLAKRNHPAVRVERFNRFLNKVVSIATSDQGSTTVFEEAAFVASYAWNSAPIDGTDILFTAFLSLDVFYASRLIVTPALSSPWMTPVSLSPSSSHYFNLHNLLFCLKIAALHIVNRSMPLAPPPPSALMISLLLLFSNKATVSLVEFKSFSTKPKVLSISLKIAISAPSKFAMLTSPQDRCLNFTPVICYSCPLWCSPFNSLIKLTFAV